MINRIEFIGTCISPEIGEISQKKGRKFSYKKAVKLIKEFYPELYASLALNFYNPWHYETKIIENKYLHINHSQIDYLFLIF